MRRFPSWGLAGVVCAPPPRTPARRHVDSLQALWSFKRWMTEWSNTWVTARRSALAPSSTTRIGRVTSRPRSRSPSSRSPTTVAFWVAPSARASGTLVPSGVMPSATTQQCSATRMPSTNSATRSSRSGPGRAARPGRARCGHEPTRDRRLRLPEAVDATPVPTASSPARNSPTFPSPEGRFRACGRPRAARPSQRRPSAEAQTAAKASQASRIGASSAGVRPPTAFPLVLRSGERIPRTVAVSHRPDSPSVCQLGGTWWRRWSATRCR